MTDTVYRVLFRDGVLAEQGRVPVGAPATPGTVAAIIPDAVARYVKADWVPHATFGATATGAALEQFRADLLARLAAARWEAQVRGVVVDGRRWHSDAEGRASLVEAVTLSGVWEETYPADRWQTRWKTADGFIVVDRAAVIAAGLAVAFHIQGVFNREALLAESIAKGDFEALAVFAEEIEGGW